MSDLKNKIAVRLKDILEQSNAEALYGIDKIAQMQAQIAMRLIFNELTKHDTIMAVCKHPMSAAMTKARIEAIINYLNEVENV